MDAKQCRMARSGLGWRAQDLAEKAGVGYASVARFESGERIADATLERLIIALEMAGATFTRRSGRIGVAVPE